MTSQNVEVEFFVRLCSDVLLEVLRHGVRRELAELEKIGRRFYLIIDCYIKEAPLLRLHLSLEPLYIFCLIFKITNHSRLRKDLGAFKKEDKSAISSLHGF